MPPELPPGFTASTESEFLLGFSWLERLRVLFGRPVRVRERTAFQRDPERRETKFTVDVAPIGGKLPE